jgi:hypothetical protein
MGMPSRRTEVLIASPPRTLNPAEKSLRATTPGSSATDRSTSASPMAGTRRTSAPENADHASASTCSSNRTRSGDFATVRTGRERLGQHPEIEREPNGVARDDGDGGIDWRIPRKAGVQLDAPRRQIGKHEVARGVSAHGAARAIDPDSGANRNAVATSVTEPCDRAGGCSLTRDGVCAVPFGTGVLETMMAVTSATQ